MANTLKFGNGEWYGKDGSILAYNDENKNFKPLPFDFTRASTGTYVGSDGLIKTARSNEPRIDYTDSTDGALLLEPSRTNLFTYSEAISNFSPKSGTFVDNFAISPDGTQNATKLTAINTDPYFYQSVAVGSGDYTISVYVKGIGSTIGKEFLLILGSGVNSTLQTITGEWKRFTFSGTLSAGTAIRGLEIPNPAVSGDELLVWGLQIEQGNYATSYIPTSGSAVTRVADTCKQENLLTDIIDASYPFTLYVDGTYNGQLSTLLSFLNKDVSQQFFLIYISSNEVFFTARSNGAIERIESGINLIKGQEYKVAVTMDSTTSGKICVNGNNVTSKSNLSLQIENSNITDLLIGQERIVSDGGIRSSVSGVKLYNTSLTDQELIALTTI